MHRGYASGVQAFAPGLNEISNLSILELYTRTDRLSGFHFTIYTRDFYDKRSTIPHFHFLRLPKLLRT